MKRKIIKIDEEICNGCGLCVPNCPEGALQIIDGKAKLVGELLCDGLGACLGECPVGAITIEERDAEDYDELKVIENIVKQGGDAIREHLQHLEEHGQTQYLQIARNYISENSVTVPLEKPCKKASNCGCPGAAMKDFSAHGSAAGSKTKEEDPVCGCPGAAIKDFRTQSSQEASVSKEKDLACGCPGSMMKDFRIESAKNDVGGSVQVAKSELSQWPIQLHLLNPNAPYFADADIVIAADCVPFTFANFHERFLKGKSLAVFCPKLDNDLDSYVEKLTELFKNNNIKSITLVHMEVPCCSGLVSIATKALKQSGKNILLKEYTISLRGEII